MINVAILGYGVVGSGVHEIIREHADDLIGKTGDKLNVKYILDIRDFSGHPDAALFTKDYDDILGDPEVSVVAEVIGGMDPAYTYTKKALEAGKSVVTSNKELVAKKGTELLKIAKENNVCYMFEASVGGGIPIIRPLNQCLAANTITEIMGILNGTTNYILTSMIKKGKGFDEALKKAQELGYAERNPSADVDGIDACRKVAILASLVTGKEVDANKIYTEGITKITLEDVKSAERLGFVIKLIGYVQKCADGKVFARVSPLLLENESPLAMVEDVFNGILAVGDSTGEVMFYGKGAGKRPTASAVVADIIDIAGNNPVGKFMWEKDDSDFMMNINDSTSQFFVRVKNISEAEAEEIFGKILCDGNDDEIAFITEEMTEKEFADKKEKLGYGNILSCIRVHR